MDMMTMSSKQCGSCRLFLDLSHFGKNKMGANGLHSSCKKCKSNYHKEWYQKNKEKRDEQKTAYKRNNKERVRAKAREYVLKNMDSIKESQRKYYDENREQILQRCRERYKRSYAQNPAKHAAKARARQLHRKDMYNRLSAAKKAEVDSIYMFCKIFKGFEVDHIVPLKGRLVSGLHTPINLQAIPIKENREKGNKFDRKDLALDAARVLSFNAGAR